GPGTDTDDTSPPDEEPGSSEVTCSGGSGDEDLLSVPVEVLAGGGLGALGEGYRLAQRWRAVVLRGEWVGRGGVGQWAGEMDAQSGVDGDHAGVEGHVVGGTGGQAVARIKPLGRGAVLPGLDVASHEHPGGAERRGLEAAKDALAAAVRQ